MLNRRLIRTARPSWRSSERWHGSSQRTTSDISRCDISTPPVRIPRRTSFGEDHKPETHLIPLVLEAAAGLRSAVKIYGTDYATEDGTCIRDYIHVTDLASAHVTGLERLSKGEVDSQAINLGTGTGASVREVIGVVREVTGLDFKAEETGRREGDPARLVASAEKAAALLDWKPGHSDLGKIVETAWQWMRRRKKV